MDDGLKCFDTAKTDAKNASHTAELAFNISENAQEVSSFRCRILWAKPFTIELLVFPVFSRFESRICKDMC